MHHYHRLFVVLTFLTLVGCQQGASPVADSLPKPAGQQESVPPSNDITAANVKFSVEPGQVHACTGQDRVISNVSWQVNDPAVKTVRVEVDEVKAPTRKVFAAGGSVGEAKTDNWVIEGVRFHLMDAGSNKELAMHQVTSLPCK